MCPGGPPAPAAPARGRRRERALLVGAVALVVAGLAAIAGLATAIDRPGGAEARGPARAVGSAGLAAPHDGARPTARLEAEPTPPCQAVPGTPGGCLPPLDGAALDGRTVSRGALAGHVVLVVFWATWCPPCLEEMPALEAIHRRHRDAGLAVVGVLHDDEVGAAEALRVSAAHGASYPSVRMTPALDRETGVEALPTAILYDRAGVPVRRWRGGLREDVLEAEVARLLRE